MELVTQSAVVAPEATAGPLLTKLMEARGRNLANASQAALQSGTRQLIGYARQLGLPALDPVSPAGWLLAGAAIALHGELQIHAADGPVTGEGVLLVEGTAVTASALLGRASQLRRAGVSVVYAFAVEIPLFDIGDGALDGVRVLARAAG